ncbi:MAG: hypothetical protein Q9222_001866 [Ikaeria aurantiellina]
MAQFRAKKLDLSCFINVRVIRDHTKRKVFEQYETQRYTESIALAALSSPSRLSGHSVYDENSSPNR